MSNENKRVKPDCPLIGEDGNIFHLVGIAAKTLRRNGMSTEATEMSEKVFNSGSYEEALGITGEYVNITSVDEPNEDIDLRMEFGGIKMIKAMIQNSPYCTEIRFPCSETELSKKLGELGMNPEHLAPIATVIEIEPSELSALEDCEVSLDALNYLGKRLDGLDKLEMKQFLAVLSCDEADIGYGLKKLLTLRTTSRVLR